MIRDVLEELGALTALAMFLGALFVITGVV